MIHAIGNKNPRLGTGVFIAWNAEVAGDVELSEGASIWFGATVRGDVATISIGRNSNVQDNAVIHADEGIPCVVGDEVTIGHGAILHACTIGGQSLIGMGAIVLNGAVIGECSVVGAGALVTQGKEFPPRSLIVGSPARAIGTLSDEDVERLAESSRHYVMKAREAREEYREIKDDRQS